MTWEVKKKFSFEAAHQLPHHSGKCRNVHGHNYVVEVTIEAGVLQDATPVNLGDDGNIAEKSNSSEGMVVDFYKLKTVMAPLIADLDHAFIAKGDEPIITHLKSQGSKIFNLGARSTAENLASYIFHHLASTLLRPFASTRVKSVEVWETPDSSAVYRE